ncbi:hypothetical protein ACFZB2_39660 [Streptomyces bobili]|uniref:hypothetical protein n=1 Tax=Streptomyces bobili TaxID=67280 RepID=UPI0036E6F683
MAGEVDPTSPWTLLRGALENFATGLWLPDGAGRDERRHRGLSLWDEDMRNRHQHEQDTGHQPSGAGRAGAQRRAEIKDIADRLGLLRGGCGRLLSGRRCGVLCLARVLGADQVGDLAAGGADRH